MPLADLVSFAEVLGAEEVATSHPCSSSWVCGMAQGPVSSRSSPILELQGARPAWPWQVKPASLPGAMPSSSCAAGIACL